MKKLSTYLFLILFSFSAPSFGDDVQDFEIEGISIGDSMLDFFSEEEIKNNIELDYFSPIQNKTFNLTELNKFPFFEIYDALQIVFKTNDKKYKIYGLHGVKDFDDINNCYKKLDKIAEEFSEMFKNAEKNDFKFIKLSEDKDIGTYSGVTFYLKFGIASAHCTDYSKEMPHIDNLRINLKTPEYEDWLWIE